jgi:hypothetical protein
MPAEAGASPPAELPLTSPALRLHDSIHPSLPPPCPLAHQAHGLSAYAPCDALQGLAPRQNAQVGSQAQYVLDSRNITHERESNTPSES